MKSCFITTRTDHIPKFFTYALVDGIFELLLNSKTGIEIGVIGIKGIDTSKIQIQLFLA